MFISKGYVINMLRANNKNTIIHFHKERILPLKTLLPVKTDIFQMDEILLNKSESSSEAY